MIGHALGDMFGIAGLMQQAQPASNSRMLTSMLCLLS